MWVFGSPAQYISQTPSSPPAGGNYNFRGPALEDVKRVTDEAVCEWLETKSNLPRSLVYHFLTLLSTGITVLPVGSTGGRSDPR